MVNVLKGFKHLNQFITGIVYQIPCKGEWINQPLGLKIVDTTL